MSSAPSYIYRNRFGVFCFQKRVPEHFLQGETSLPKFIRKSLFTKSRRKALAKARKFAVMFDELAQQYFRSPEEFAAAIKLLQQYKDAVAQFPRFADFQENFLDTLDDVTGRDSRLLDKAVDYEKAKQIVSGSPSPAQTERNSEILDAIKNQHKAHLRSIPITDAFDQFINDRKTNWRGANTEIHYRRDVFALFKELVADIETGDLEKSHIILYKQAVLEMPANRNKSPKYSKLSIQKVIEEEIPEEDQISARTKQKYLQRLSGFLVWLHQHDYAIDNLHTPLQKVVSNKSVASEERNKYTCEDLKKLFNSRAYQYGSHKEVYQFWVPLIALFTGARLNEICQLHISDIYEHEQTKIWVFDINQDNAKETLKSIKRGEHIRLIPIHPTLKKLGFIEFYGSVKKKTKRLFPELPYHSANKFGYKAQKWFNSTYTNKRNCNIETSNTSFHSLRHTLETYLANKLEIPVHKIEMMMGQKPSGGVSTGRYIKPIDLKERYSYIQKVNFDDCIDFNKIRPWKQQRFARIAPITSRRKVSTPQK